METLLNDWLPGGITSVYVISMSAKERDSVERHVRPHFPDMQHVDGYRPVVNSLADYRRLPYKVSDRTQMHIYGNEGQAHHRDISSLGGIGCAISHLELWRKAATNPSGWSVIIEWDCVFKADSIKTVSTFVQQAAPGDSVGMLRLGFNSTERKNQQPVVGNTWFVKNRTHQAGTRMYIVANKWARAYYDHLSPTVDMHIDLALNLGSYLQNLPETWFLQKSLCGTAAHVSAITPVQNLRKLFPDNAAASTAIILLVLILLGILFVLVIAVPCAMAVKYRRSCISVVKI
jgi:GR25 family glycosyltransferase involved in LPS biosynthesis